MIGIANPGLYGRTFSAIVLFYKHVNPPGLGLIAMFHQRHSPLKVPQKIVSVLVALIIQPQLAADDFAVVINGAFGNIQAAGNLLGTHPNFQQRADVQLQMV